MTPTRRPPAALDPTQSLARCARNALGCATQVTLLVDGLRDQAACASLGGGPQPLLLDREGEPRFVCPGGSPLVAAAGRPAVLEVPLRVDGAAAVAALTGTLARIGTERLDGATMPVLALRLRTVVVAQPVRGAAPRLTDIPLAVWSTSTPDPLAAPAARIVEHTNAAHEPEVVEFVASVRGLPAPSVLGARLASLDRCGGLVHWVDAEGGHVERIAFPRPARCERELAALLRAALSV